MADDLAERTGLRLSRESVYRLLRAGGIHLSRPQHTITSPDPESALNKTAIGDARDHLMPGEVFYCADEVNISWHPTLRALWSPAGQQVMITTPAQPTRRYALGAVNYHTGETVVLTRTRKRRREVAELLAALLAKHPTGTVYVVWDNADTHEEEVVDAVVRAAAGRLVLLYLPTYSPWLSPIEMLWRHFRREVTHGALFASLHALLEATREFVDRYNRTPIEVLSIIGAPIPQNS